MTPEPSKEAKMTEEKAKLKKATASLAKLIAKPKEAPKTEEEGEKKS